MFDRLKSVAGSLKRELNVYRLVLKDNRTPWPAKLLLGLAIGYLLLPFDLIPDFIPSSASWMMLSLYRPWLSWH